MFSALRESMGVAPSASVIADVTRASPSNSIPSSIVIESSNAQSSSSTPPTSVGGDNASLSSTPLQPDAADAKHDHEPSRRSIRSRASISTYNVKILTGTAIHTPQKWSKDPRVKAARRSRGTRLSAAEIAGASASSTPIAPKPEASNTPDGEEFRGTPDGQHGGISMHDNINALDLHTTATGLPSLSKPKRRITMNKPSKKSAKHLDSERRKSLPTYSKKNKIFADSPAPKAKKGLVFEMPELASARALRELKKLQDTPEFAKIETQPVVEEVWSNGKLVVHKPESKKKADHPTVTEKSKLAKAGKEVEQFTEKKKLDSNKERKRWLSKGLYAGQVVGDMDYDGPATSDAGSPFESAKTNSALPLPLWHGRSLIERGRDFKLPFDICSPLPPGQPKPDEWRKTSSNRFVGEASTLWKKSGLFDSFSSKCVCKPATGCGDNCQNRIMLYECDDQNCGAGREHCNNRSFANLMERRKAGGKYRIGVEVVKTPDRGYGVRSNRCFEANQIIVEYTGEIITEEECDRRMNEDYKDNECYYLMLFDQNMVLDATKGSIARFVNHSCKPNCRMVKWIVGGKPRMALFAGDSPIMTGDELTYDYNFDPFSAKNVQQCRCGNDNCRGILGPKPKDVKPPNELLKHILTDVQKSAPKIVKRKLKEITGGDLTDEEEEAPRPKKSKTAAIASPQKRRGSEKKKIKGPSSASIEAAKKAMHDEVDRMFAEKLAKATKPKRSFAVKKTPKASSLKTFGKAASKMASKALSKKAALASSVKKGLKKNAAKSTMRSKGSEPQTVKAGTVRVAMDDDAMMVDEGGSDGEYFDEDEEN